MKRSNRLVMAALCLIATGVQAQTGPTPVSSSSYTYIGSFNASHVVTECPSQGTAAKEEYHWVVTLWRSSTDAMELSISPASFSVDDGCGTIGATSAAAVFDLLGTESVRMAAALGHLALPSSCSSPAATTVSYAPCVTRSGSGSSTTFSGAGSTLSRHDFSFCQSGGSIMVTATGTSGQTSCGSGSEPTWGGSNLE
jgi:hypothetical protein